jgi:hypothetical protein
VHPNPVKPQWLHHCVVIGVASRGAPAALYQQPGVSFGLKSKV